MQCGSGRYTARDSVILGSLAYALCVLLDYAFGPFVEDHAREQAHRQRGRVPRYCCRRGGDTQDLAIGTETVSNQCSVNLWRNRFSGNDASLTCGPSAPWAMRAFEDSDGWRSNRRLHQESLRTPAFIGHVVRRGSLSNCRTGSLPPSLVQCPDARRGDSILGHPAASRWCERSQA
jgi:hypothetical protein